VNTLRRHCNAYCTAIAVRRLGVAIAGNTKPRRSRSSAMARGQTRCVYEWMHGMSARTLRRERLGLAQHTQAHSPACLMEWRMQWREQLDKKGFAAGPTAGRILGYKGHVPGKQNQVGVASNEYDALRCRAPSRYNVRCTRLCGTYDSSVGTEHRWRSTCVGFTWPQ